MRFTFVYRMCLYGAAWAVPGLLGAQSETYVEAGGVLVVEVESHAPQSPWTEESSGGVTYLRGGEDHFNSPGIGVLSYRFTVLNAGRYQINWRSRIGNGSQNTEHNDSFARLTDSSGNPLAPVSNSNTATGSAQWYKLYMNRLSWDYETSNRDNDPKSLSWNLAAGQTYVFQISTRSKDHLLDRFVLWNHGMHDYANKSTGKSYSSTSASLDALDASSTDGGGEPPPPPPPPPDDLVHILFVRGGEGTTGFLSGPSEDLASDITNFSTGSRNHGWGQLAALLEANGYATEQVIEGPASAPAPIDFHTLDLSPYQVIVLGSNNADYAPDGDFARIDAIEDFVRRGGGLLLISDANFGQSWSDASNSDQQFLDRFGLTINQDIDTYTSARADGDYVNADHPILSGIGVFDGQGVTAFSLGPAVPGVYTEILVRAEQDVRRNNSPAGGTVEPASGSDGALVIALAGGGRVAGHYDPNTFFNENGAGTRITAYDNADYALNLFNWLAGGTSPEVDADSSEVFKLYHFNEADRGRPEVSGDLANLDGDAFPNGVEYVLGLDPWHFDQVKPLTVQSSDERLRLEFTVRQDLASGYSVELRQNDVLNEDAWNAVDLGSLRPEETRPGFWTYTVNVDPDTSGDQSFWRLHFAFP